jgi:hypothetical protein
MSRPTQESPGFSRGEEVNCSWCGAGTDKDYGGRIGATYCADCWIEAQGPEPEPVEDEGTRQIRAHQDPRLWLAEHDGAELDLATLPTGMIRALIERPL